jgi:hypothetical protein
MMRLWEMNKGRRREGWWEGWDGMGWSHVRGKAVRGGRIKDIR